MTIKIVSFEKLLLLKCSTCIYNGKQAVICVFCIDFLATRPLLQNKHAKSRHLSDSLGRCENLFSKHA